MRIGFLRRPRSEAGSLPKTQELSRSSASYYVCFCEYCPALWCTANKIKSIFKSFLASLLLVTSQTRSASVESREVEALSNLQRRRPRGPSLGRISRRKAAAVSLENKNFASSMYVSGAGPRPCSFFLGPATRTSSRASPRMVAQVCSRSHRSQDRYNRLGRWSSCPGDF
jgi:hypothetical protein